ncbi:S8 family peptidase [Lewinella cohaerens]|uniref:S8 family peptidase n=1 Tax=Lewinella cohaerens TaxID=70995 RepID=UPI00039A6205|nr:S8 family peptidase [Lewinella cohaerens]
MKTVVSTFLAFFFMMALFAQNFVADEFIVGYVAGTTSTERQAVRDLFGITNATDIGEGIELWSDITFPLSVIENGETTIIGGVEELLYYINIQEGDDDDSGTTNTSASINNGNLNLLLQLEEDGAFNEDGTFDPLPYCDDIHNYRLIGEDQSDNPYQKSVKVIIVDQIISGIDNINLIVGGGNQGGDHGNKVYSVINNILSQAGISGIEYLNLVAFDENGSGTAGTLLELALFLREQFESGLWNSEDKIIINFSASLYTGRGDLPPSTDILKYQWATVFGSNSGSSPYVPYENITLISSAGNQNLNSGRNIFPGEVDFATEVTVAGTQECFSQPWMDTNASSSFYEIAAEATNVLTQSNGQYYLSSGTSFSAPMVTAVVAQLVLMNPSLNMTEIKDLLLNTAEEVPALISTVQDGRVLNLDNYIPSGGGDTSLLQGHLPTSPLTLTTTPNPFSTTALVTIQLPEAGDVTINMYNMMGQRVHEEFIANQQELLEIEWPTPTKLAPGTYLLRVQVGDAVEQMMMVKQ